MNADLLQLYKHWTERFMMCSIYNNDNDDTNNINSSS
jgi:hypothetical protein